MSITTPLKRFFRSDHREVEAFLRREEKYRRRAGPGTHDVGNPDADRLRYEVLRARI